MAENEDRDLGNEDLGSENLGYASSNNIFTGNGQSNSVSKGFSEDTSNVGKQTWSHTGTKRVVTSGPEVVRRDSTTTEGIPEGTVEITPRTNVDILANPDPRGKAIFTAVGDGRTTHGYDWFEDLALQNNRHIGLTCDIPGGTYSHGEDGPVGTHFLRNAGDNVFTTVPYVLCDHHTRLKQQQHVNDPNIRFDPIKAQDVEKHLAKTEALRNSAAGTLEGGLRTGGYQVLLPAGAPKPPRNVVLPPGDLLFGQETETKGARSGAIRGVTPSVYVPKEYSHLTAGAHESRENNGWLPPEGHLGVVNQRRSNAEKEDILNQALNNLRANDDTSEEEQEEHIKSYHSSDSVLPKDDSGNEYCPTCSDIYARTVDSTAGLDDGTRKANRKYFFNPVDAAGVQRTRKPGQEKSEESPPRVGQSLPKESQTRESVPFGDLQTWTESNLPAHMLMPDAETGEVRAFTPLEKFAEEQLTKQEVDIAQQQADKAISYRNRNVEAFKGMSRAEQIEYQRQKSLEFKAGRGPFQIEAPE